MDSLICPFIKRREQDASREDEEDVPLRRGILVMSPGGKFGRRCFWVGRHSVRIVASRERRNGFYGTSADSSASRNITLVRHSKQVKLRYQERLSHSFLT